MSNAQHGFWKKSLVIGLAVLVSWAGVALAQRPPRDLPVPEGIEPESPKEEHSPANRTAIQPAARASIHMRDVAEPAPSELEGLFFHVQGDPGSGAGEKGVELVPGDSVFGEKGRHELPEPEFPEVMDPSWMDLEAVGDFVTSFEGISDNGWIPPDTVLAVGPSHVVEAVNSGFTIYSKTGSTVQTYRTFNTFFNPILPSPWSGFLFDPRIIYDSFHSKYVMLVLGRDDNNQQSYVFLGISTSSSPTGSWYLYRYHADHGSHSHSWLDYASLGADLWGLYFTGNYFRWSDNDFRYATIWAISPNVFSGGSGVGTQFYDLEWPAFLGFGSKAFGLQVAHPHSQSNGETFFVNTHSGSGDDILLWELTGDRASSPSLSKSKIGMRDYDAIGNNVDQPGSSTDIDGGDSRVMNAVFAQRRVYATLASAPTGSSGGWITVRVNVDSTSKEWDTLLWSGDGHYYTYPAITISGGTSTCARIGLMGTWTHATTQHPSGVFKIYDGCNTTSGPFISFISGQSSYVKLDSNGRNRWGDYSGAAYDWQTGHLWGAVEYAGTSNTWRTRIAARKFAPDLSANFFSSCYGLTCNFYSTTVVGAFPISSYLWTFSGTTQTASGSSAQRTFPYAGTYLVTLKVTDTSGATSTKSSYVTVSDDPCSLELPYCEEEIE